MRLQIEADLRYGLTQATDVLLQLEAAAIPGQKILQAETICGDSPPSAHIPAEDGIGRRLWLKPEHELTCSYRALVEIDRPVPDYRQLAAEPLSRLPADVVKYLMPSRYCPADQFHSFAASEFEGLEGGKLIGAMADWIAGRLQYVPGASNAQTTAVETFVQRCGVCRDYAHMMIALSRAAGIPARFVSLYAPDVDPPDFHAVAQIYLDGGWNLVDTTGMAEPHEMAIVGVGVDAAHVPFMSSFGAAELIGQTVAVKRV